MPSGEPGDATEFGATVVTGASTPVREAEREHGSSVRAGDTLAGYRIVRRLGAGGMGEVFAAIAPDGRELALKLLGRASATHLVRFKREFRALADVDHQNLVRLHELVVPADGPPLFTMELVDGQPFTQHVRGELASGVVPELDRLLDALRQLVLGIHELHAAGRVHRDLKPSNVLVDRDGRVVILDFGLVSELDSHDEGVTHDGQLLGTPAYMAPEQGMSGKAGPPADHYAIGVMLFECLTGQRPFVGSALAMLMAKQDAAVPDPAALIRSLGPERRAEGMPSWLRELCMRLLAVDPFQRPSGREILDTLDAAGEGSASASSMSSGARLRDTQPTQLLRKLAFVGRAHELAQLDAALTDSQARRSAVTVLVRGVAGIGKSALIHQWLHAQRSRGAALILSGRCLERESVPYKGIDAVVDALSLHLRRLPEAELERARPRHVAALARLFPVLADVWPGQGDHADHGDHGDHANQANRVEHGATALLDATELRRVGLSALRELVVDVAARAPLIVAIDDFHWSDLDSLRLLAALLRPPDTPRMLLIMGFRDEPEHAAALAELRATMTLDGRELRELELAPLGLADALTLARALVGEGQQARVELLADRARGNPLMLTQLALGDDGSNADAELDEVLGRRVAGLEPSAHRLLALVAIASGPVSREAVLAALSAEAETRSSFELGPGESPEDIQIRELIANGLLLSPRTSPGAAAELLELAHGRVRDVVLATLTHERATALHMQLAAALERLGGDAQALAEHYARAGDHERAAAYAERGAMQAVEALAFGRAVELYRRTLLLLPDDEQNHARRRALQIALVEQLINLGHASEAADALLALAATAESGSAMTYRVRALSQLARCGRIDEALALAAELLHALGEPMPRGHWGHVAMIVREQLRLRLRGESFVPRDEAELDTAQRMRLDTLIAIAHGLTIHEVMLTQAIGSRALRLALDAGEPRRIALMSSYRFIAYAGLGLFDRAAELAIVAREHAAMADDLEVHRANDLAEAVLEWFRPRVVKARQLFGAILTRAEDQPVADWVRAFSTIRYTEMSMLMGDYADIRRRNPALVAAARERGNLFEIASLEALCVTASLYVGDLDGARRHLQQARASWQSTRYTFTDVTIDIAHTGVLMLDGQLDEAGAYLREVVGRMRSSGLGHIQTVDDLIAGVMARHRVLTALAAPHSRDAMRAARSALRLPRRCREPLRNAEALIFAATLSTLAGDLPGARRAWRRAVHYCDGNDMRAHLAAARLRLAEHGHGHEARELEQLGRAYLDGQGIDDQQAFLDVLAPVHRD